MGRIFETRKAHDVRPLEPDGEGVHPDRQGDRHRGQGGRAEPRPQPAAAPRRSRTPAPSNMPKDKVEAAIKRASGQDGDDYQEVIYEGYAPHGIAMLVETATDNPTRTVANVRDALQQVRRQHRQRRAASRFLFRRMGVFRLAPGGHRRRTTLELDLIDHGLEEMGEGTGEKGEPQLVVRCAFADFGRLQRAIEERGITRSRRSRSTSRSTRSSSPRTQANGGAEAGRRARAGRRRPAGVPQPGVAGRWRAGQRPAPTAVRARSVGAALRGGPNGYSLSERSP